jgi:putative redox protein
MKSEQVSFTGSLGGRLAARLDAPDGPARAHALFAHCFTCSKDIFAASRIAQALVEQGIAVLRFDFTGLGHSEGEFANTNFSSNVQDLVAAGAWLRGHDRAPSLLIGHSLGGAAVLVAAGGMPEVRAVATIGAPSDVGHVTGLFREQVPEIEAQGEALVQIAGRPFRIRREFLADAAEQNVRDHVGKLGRALLILHSPVDETVAIGNATGLFVNAKHPKSFVSLADADHLLRRHSDAVYAANIIAAWSERYLSWEQEGTGTPRPRPGPL